MRLWHDAVEGESGVNMVLTYIGLSVLSGAAIIATWHIMNKRYHPKKRCNKLFFDCLANPEGCGEHESVVEWYWGPPGIGKVYPCATLGCDVCGRWTVGLTCSDCEAWAAIQICHYTKRLPSFDLALREHKRLVDAAGW